LARRSSRTSRSSPLSCWRSSLVSPGREPRSGSRWESTPPAPGVLANFVQNPATAVNDYVNRVWVFYTAYVNHNVVP
jgi:hypothetical protein